MNDLEFFTELAQEWQRDTAALEVSRRKVLRQQWLNRMAFGGELGFSCVSLWVAWFFWQQEATVFTVSALVLALNTPLSLWVTFRERLPLWHWHDWSPEGVLTYRVRQCESTLRLARYCWYSGGVLLLFLVYIWVNEFVAPGSTPSLFPVIYTVAILATVACLLLWARRQERVKARELAQLILLLQSFDL
jgi:drug/metabolite transporter (DMT)-like permease